MKVEMKKWEIERVKEKIGEILQFWAYSLIEVKDGSGRSMSMSIKTFLEQLEEKLSKD